MLDLNDLDVITKHMDGRYVRIDDCNDVQKETAKKFSSDDKRLSNIEGTLNIFKKLGWVAVSALIAEVALTLFEVITSL